MKSTTKKRNMNKDLREKMSAKAMLHLRNFIKDATTLTFKETEICEVIKNKMNEKLNIKQAKVVELIKFGKSREEIISEVFNMDKQSFIDFMKLIYKTFAEKVKFQNKKNKFADLQFYLINGYQKDYYETETTDKAITVQKIDKNNPYEINGMSLSKRETEVLNLLLDGFSYPEIAEKAFISLTTVKTHVNAIFEKKLVNSLQQLIVGEYKKKISALQTFSPNELQTPVIDKADELQKLILDFKAKLTKNYDSYCTELGKNYIQGEKVNTDISEKARKLFSKLNLLEELEREIKSK